MHSARLNVRVPVTMHMKHLIADRDVNGRVKQFCETDELKLELRMANFACKHRPT